MFGVFLWMLGRQRGLGCLPALITVLLLLAGMAVFFSSDNGGIVAIGGGVGVIVATLLGHLLALGLNSHQENGERVWTDYHASFDVPIQRNWGPLLIIAIALIAGGVGHLTSWLVGWGLFIVGLIALRVLPARPRSRAQYAAIAERREFATANGLRFQPGDSTLARRWSDLFGSEILAIRPFGVLAGSAHGLPFTVFDDFTFRPDQPLPRSSTHRETIFLAHLPAEYPMAAIAPGDEGASEVHCANSGFAETLRSTAVTEIMARMNIQTWALWGRDLVVTAPNRPPAPAAITVERAQRVAEFASLISARLPAAFATEPETGIPLTHKEAA